MISREKGLLSTSPASQQPSCPLAVVLSFQKPSPICHPERTRISYSPISPATANVVLLKENHMQLIEAATLDRKSGEAEGPAVRPSGASHVPGSHKLVLLRPVTFRTTGCVQTFTKPSS